MAYQANPDGTYNVTDDVTGLPVLSGIPSAYLDVPQVVAPPAMGQALAAGGPNAAQALGAAFGPSVTLPGASPPPAAPAPPPPSVPDTGPSFPSAMPGPGVTVAGPVSSGVAPASEVPAWRRQQATGGAPPAEALVGPGAGRPGVSGDVAGAPGAPADPTADIMQTLLAQAAIPKPGAYVNRPEADVLQGFRTERQKPISDETKETLREAYSDQIATQDVAQKFRAAGIAPAAEGFATRREQSIQEANTIRAREAMQNRMLTDRMAPVHEATRALREAKAGFNPDAYWDDKGEFGTLMTKVGIGLGAMGGAVTGRPNEVLEQVNREIDRNVSAQLKRIEFAGDEVQSQLGLVGIMREQFDDSNAAELAARGMMLEAFAAEMQQNDMFQKSADSQAVALETVAALRTAAEESMAKAEALEAGQIAETYKHQQAFKGSVGGTKGGLEAVIAQGKKYGLTAEQSVRLYAQGMLPPPKATGGEARAQQQREKDALSRQVVLPDGRIVWASQDAIAKEKQASLNGLAELRSNIEEMERIVSEVNLGRLPASDTESRLRPLISRNRYLVQEGGIAHESLTQGERENFDPLAGGDLGQILNRVNDKATIDQLYKILDKSVRTDAAVLYADPEGKQLLAPRVAGEKKAE